MSQVSVLWLFVFGRHLFFRNGVLVTRSMWGCLLARRIGSHVDPSCCWHEDLVNTWDICQAGRGSMRYATQAIVDSQHFLTFVHQSLMHSRLQTRYGQMSSMQNANAM